MAQVKKKLLFVVNYLMGGGVEQMLINVVRCTYREYDVEVLSIYNIGSFYLDEIKQYVKVFTLDKYRGSLHWSGIKSLYSRWFDKESAQRLLFKQFLKNNYYDILIAFSEGYAMKLVAGIDIPGTKKDLWVHTDFLADDECVSNNIKSLRKTFSEYNNIIFVCESLRDKFTKLLHLKSTSCINNCIDIERIRILSEKLDITKPNGVTEFVSVGRLSHEKGHDRLIAGIATLSKLEQRKCHLTIVGGGSMESELKLTVKNLGLESTVTFIGAVNNPYPYIKNADALLLASKYEGFGLVLLEAMALNTPVVATNTIGAIDVLRDGKYGLLIPNNDMEIGKTIHSLAADINQLDKFRPNLLTRAEEFSLNSFKQKVIEYFRHE